MTTPLWSREEESLLPEQRHEDRCAASSHALAGDSLLKPGTLITQASRGQSGLQAVVLNLGAHLHHPLPAQPKVLMKHRFASLYCLSLLVGRIPALKKL
jgi:hypothetical protein